ncbi:MAG: xanthine dehydrogenase family protein molybdopterin-binding subunit, partial [Stellaceae bacterium]
MNAESAAGTATGIGAPVRRVEDERLLTGAGRYADDVRVPNLAYAAVVRSPHAHALIRGIDRRAAAAAAGVLAVLTGEDVVREGLGALTCESFPKATVGARPYCPQQPILAQGKVRHVGDRVALVIAETLAQAKDAAELMEVEYEPRPAVTLADAIRSDAAKIWDEAEGNLAFEIETGERRAVDQAFAAARHVSRIAVHYPRAAPNLSLIHKSEPT